MGEDEIKVSELNRAITVNSADDMMIIQDGANKKVSGDRFFEKIKSIIKPVVLWENLNPEAGMEENTNIDLLDAEYDEIRWFFIFSNSGANLEIQQSISCQKQNSVSLFTIGYNTGDTVRRTLEYVSKTQYKALAGKRNNANDSNCCIPVKAVGIKYLNINGNNDDVKIPNQILNEYLEAFNNNFTDKTAEFNNSVEVKISEAKEEINNSLSGSNKYARALKGTVQDASFAQIYADSPVVEGLEIKGKELTQKTRDDKNKFSTTFSQNGATRIKSGTIKVEANTQYTFSATSTLGHPLQYAVNYYNADSTLISSSAYYNNGSSFTTPANTETINIQVRDFENSGTSNTINVAEVIEPQLEIGSVATEYQEPGASPSIEYPSEIENVVDNKNKFNANSDNITFIKDSNIEALTKINNNSIKIESKLNWSREKVKIANLKPKTPYNVSCIISSVTGDLINTTRGIWNGINLVDSDLVTENVNRRLKIDISTDSDGVLTFWFYCNYSSNNLTGTIIFDEIKVTEGKGMTDSGIVLDIVGKNFIGYKENGTATNQGVTVEYENGVFTLNGTVTQERDLYFNLIDVLTINSYANQFKQPKRKLYKNKYMLSYKFISGTKSRADMNFGLLDEMANWTSKFNINNCHYTNKSMVIDIPENLDYYAYFWLPKNMTFTDFKFEIQLEVGENITEIEPYKNKSFNITLPEGKFLGGINNNKNIITKINEKWKLKKCIKKIEFNGTEDWEMDSTGVYHILKSKIPGMNLPYNSIDMICNCFLVTTGTTAIGTFRVGTSYLNFNYDDGIGGLANWKTKLAELNNAGTPLTVYYLVDEEEEELPTATQTILNSIELYEDINNIAVEDGTVSFRYNKSLAREFEKIYSLIGVINTVQESEVLSNADN